MNSYIISTTVYTTTTCFNP